MAARPTTPASPLPRSASLAVLAAALGLGVFVGPTSIRRVFHVLAHGGATALAPLLLERVVLTAVLVLLLRRTTVWLARALSRRHGLSGERAAEVAALGLTPFPLLATALVPGLWGDRTAEPFSFAMLFLFVSVALCSALLAGAAFTPSSIAPRRRATAHGLAVVAACLAIGLLRPFAVEPHWTIPGDEAPFWPTDAFLAAYALGFAALAAPLLAASVGAMRRGRRAAGWIGAVAGCALATALGMGAVTALKRDHDLAELALRFPPGAEVWTEMGGRGAMARVLAPEGLRWSPPRGGAVTIEVGSPLEARTWAQRRERVELIVRRSGPRSAPFETRLDVSTGPAGDAPPPARLRLVLPEAGGRLEVRPVDDLGPLPVLVRVL